MLIFRYFSFTFYIQFILLAGKKGLENKKFDQFTLGGATLPALEVSLSLAWLLALTKSFASLVIRLVGLYYPCTNQLGNRQATWTTL